MVSSTDGFATRLRYHSGSRSSPPFDATSTIRSPSTTGADSTTVRRRPLPRPAPRSTTIGIPTIPAPKRHRLTLRSAAWPCETVRNQRSESRPRRVIRCLALAPLAHPHVDHDRRALEPVDLAQTPLDEPAVARVEESGREQHECRGPARGLRAQQGAGWFFPRHRGRA